VNNFAMHICEPEITALKTMCQFRMVKAKLVEKSRLQIMNVDWFLGYPKAQIITRSIG
jgi:hypothetical protein